MKRRPEGNRRREEKKSKKTRKGQKTGGRPEKDRRPTEDQKRIEDGQKTRRRRKEDQSTGMEKIGLDTTEALGNFLSVLLKLLGGTPFSGVVPLETLTTNGDDPQPTPWITRE